MAESFVAGLRTNWRLVAAGCVVAAFIAAGVLQYHRTAMQAAREQAEEDEDAAWSNPGAEAPRSPGGSDAHPRQQPRKTRDVFATWYDVPEDSLAKRRAGSNEFTAAHNRLPIGTLVRVTHLKNGKSVVVRITDRGIHDRRVKLDLCKQAAEELEIVRKGVARVRMEVLPEEHGASPADPSVAASHL